MRIFPFNKSKFFSCDNLLMVNLAIVNLLQFLIKSSHQSPIYSNENNAPLLLSTPMRSLIEPNSTSYFNLNKTSTRYFRRRTKSTSSFSMDHKQRLNSTINIYIIVFILIFLLVLAAIVGRILDSTNDVAFTQAHLKYHRDSAVATALRNVND